MSEHHIGKDVSESTIEWLSLIRYQLLTSDEQARLAPPLSSLAINTVQDAVESCLSLVTQSRGGALNPRADFLQLFDAAVAHGNDADVLRAFRPAMSAMNTARVNFKHHGNAPNEQATRRHNERASEFVHTLVRGVFSLELDTVSLLSFIKNAEARQLLEQAQDLWNAGNGNDAMETLRLAFDKLVKDYTARKQWAPGTDLFSTKPSFYPSTFDLRDTGMEKLSEWIGNIDKWIRYVALGINTRAYAYFNAYTPNISYAMGGNHFAQFREGIEITDEVFSRCFKFVVDTALGLGRDDFDFDYWSVRQEVYARRRSENRAAQDD